jgi:hypothetical protein
MKNDMTTETVAAARVPPELMRERSAHLALVAAELKTELFGIDDIIDRVIESIRAWYVLPHIIRRPVIVCLWGLTGTGKTQLTRRLAQKLGFYDRFVEVQMDGFSNGSSWRSADSISAMLAESAIAESEPGMLVLDEFQRFRTIDEKARRSPSSATRTSGNCCPTGACRRRCLSCRSSNRRWPSRCTTTSARRRLMKSPRRMALPKKLKFALSPYQAQEFRQSLKLKEPLQEVMTWTPQQLQERMLAFKASTESWETDYSRLLIIVSGNLDEMYEGTAKRVEDCDTDADIFHALTKKLSVIDVKKALGERFKPEQIARLGNNHVIYPVTEPGHVRAADTQHLRQIRGEMQASSGLSFELHESVYQGIYANAVFPAQGTRPLFSSIHAILSAPLVNAVLWAFEHGVPAGTTLHVRLDAATQSLHVSHRPKTGAQASPTRCRWTSTSSSSAPARTSGPCWPCTRPATAWPTAACSATRRRR